MDLFNLNHTTTKHDQKEKNRITKEAGRWQSKKHLIEKQQPNNYQIKLLIYSKMKESGQGPKNYQAAHAKDKQSAKRSNEITSNPGKWDKAFTSLKNHQEG